MDTIGRYHIEGELGKGAMGVVYKATDPNIGRTVALKTMRLDVHGIEAEEMLQRFRNEARAAGVLNHPNIVTIYDAGEASGLFYMAMEVIEGQTLQHLLAKYRVLPVEQILTVCRQVGEGLDFAHAKGVIHRDVKPANIMITPSGLVKIMDFGIAKAGGGLTSTGQVLGTPNYMSPEQVKGKTLDGRSDLFSLGVCLYEMLTGEKPFGAQNVTTIIYKIVHEDPIPPRELDVSIHPGLSAAVSKALAKAPDARYQTGAAMAHDLENYKSFGSDLDDTKTMHVNGDTAIVDNATSIAQAAAAGTIQTPVAPIPSASTTGARQSLESRSMPASATGSARVNASASQKRVPVPQQIEQVQDTIQRAAPGRRAAAKSGNKGLVLGAVALLVVVLGVFGARSLMKKNAAQPAPATTATQTTPPGSQTGTQPESTLPPADSATVAGGGPLAKANEPAPFTTPVTPAKPPAPTPAKPEAAVVTTGDLVITSKPDGATVKLDGKKAIGTTPLTQKGLPAGKHTLTLSLPGYLTALKSVDITAGGSATTDVTLVAANGTVKLNSVPPGANVFVDGVDSTKKTPAEFSLPKGDHTFMLRMNGFEEAGDLINVTPGQTIQFAPTLTAKQSNPFRKMGRVFGGDDKGQLQVETTPPGAFVFVNGRRLPQQTPVKLPVPAGQYFMAIRKPGFKPVQKQITIEKGKPTKISQPLTAKED